MQDVVLLSLTAFLTWAMWRALETWGAGVEAWAWACAWWVTRLMREV